MSAASLGHGNNLFKGGNRQDFVNLLLQDLERFDTLRNKSFVITGNQFIKSRLSTKIRREVEEMTNFLTAIDEWESEVLNSFFKIKWFSRKYQNEDEFLSRMDQNEKELKSIRTYIKKLKQKVPKIGEKASDKPSQSTTIVSQTENKTFEVGESSNSSVKDTNRLKNDGSDEHVKCAEELNAQQKELLYSLAIFPENTELKKRLLVNWWIGLGLLPIRGDTSAMENQSVDIFSQLEEKNILKPKRIRKHNGVVDSYTIDPTIHEQFISDFKRERCIESKEMKGLQFYKDGKNEVVAVLNLKQKHLNFRYISTEPTIKVVQLGKWRYTDLNGKTIFDVAGTKFMEKMGEAVTYLSLRGISRIEELPQSIGKTRGLKVLDLKDCHSLQKLPQKPKSVLQAASCKDDKWFEALTHLDITGCYLLDHMPKWVCELSNLQVLKGALFNGFIPEGQEQSHLKDLSKLQKLTKLSIKIIHPHLLSPDDCAGLEPLSRLLVLTIVWGIREIETKKQSGDNVKYISGTGEQITGVSKDQDVVTEKQSRENFRGKILGKVKKDKKMKEKKQIKKNTPGENNEDGLKIPTIYLPENLEKLDIRCYPNAEAPELRHAAKFKNLKRLYIRGGKLAKLWGDVDWQVEILRLRFLKFLEVDWYELGGIFPKLKCVEYKGCPRLKFFPGNSGSWRNKIDGPFPSHIGETRQHV